MATLSKILLLGDSIRMSYRGRVGEMFAGRADVVGPGENCRHTLYSLERLEAWRELFTGASVVHWNNGLWDCGFCPNRAPKQFSVEDYTANLGHMLRQIRVSYAPGVPVIWATMTPQHPDRAFSDESWSWRSADIVRYNEAASALMKKEGVPINDLHTLIAADPGTLLGEDKLHLSAAGVEKCATAVAAAVERVLPA